VKRNETTVLRRRLALGPVGDYVLNTQSGVSNQVLAARGDLMAAVARVCPQFFESLRSLQGEYQRHESLLRREPWYWHPALSFGVWVEHSERLHQEGGPLSGQAPLGPKILKWAQKYGADQEDWILAGAVEALSCWIDRDFCDGEAPRGAFTMRGGARQSVAPRAFRFNARPWSPEFERWETYVNVVRERCERALARYERRIKGRIPIDLTPSPRRWSAHRFEWFARCQFAGESPASILTRRDSEKGDSTTVTKALHNVAKLVGWQGPVRHLRNSRGK
jgi:hypothetical protein